MLNLICLVVIPFLLSGSEVNILFIKVMVKIHLFVVVPGVKIIRFNVEHDIKIDRIMDVVGRQYTLIYNGTILLPGFSIEFYNLKHGDRIWGVFKNNTSSINLLMSTNCSFKYLVDLMDRLRQERKYAKVREFEETKGLDFYSSKIESDPKEYRKLLKFYGKLEDKELSTPLQIIETNYVKPVKPCSDPLPPFWKKPVQNKIEYVHLPM